LGTPEKNKEKILKLIYYKKYTNCGAKQKRKDIFPDSYRRYSIAMQFCQSQITENSGLFKFRNATVL